MDLKQTLVVSVAKIDNFFPTGVLQKNGFKEIG